MPIAIPAFTPALPELLVLGGALALLLFGAIRGERSTAVVDTAAIALLVAAAVLVALLPGGRIETFGGSFVLDSFARFMKILALGGAAAALLMSLDFWKKEIAVWLAGASPAWADAYEVFCRHVINDFMLTAFYLLVACCATMVIASLLMPEPLK
ncbi:MAG: hypothetical protein Q7S17_01410, partial [Xanthobacteraceae bacterium]|nr:hypothetical protein [Xanthobacteraceae bacterium]